MAAGGVGRPNLEDPGNLEPKPPEPLQINLFLGKADLKPLGPYGRMGQLVFQRALAEQSHIYLYIFCFFILGCLSTTPNIHFCFVDVFLFELNVLFSFSLGVCVCVVPLLCLLLRCGVIPLMTRRLVLVLVSPYS